MAIIYYGPAQGPLANRSFPEVHQPKEKCTSVSQTKAQSRSNPVWLTSETGTYPGGQWAEYGPVW